MRFLHTSDWQLGMTRHFLTGEAQARFSEARLDAIGTLAELATARDCAFVVVAGDVFETNQPDARTVTRALERLGRFTVPVYLLPGNHDPYDPSSIYRNRAFVDRCPPHVQVLSDMTAHTPVPGVEVVGAPWPNKEPLRDLVADACDAFDDDDVLRVVVGHGGVAEVSGSFDAAGTVELARVEAALVRGCVSYVALGDRHSCTQVGASGRVWFSGTPEPTAYVEEDAGTALVVDLGVDPPAVERCEVGTWTFHELVQPVDSEQDLDTLEAALDGIAEPARAIVKLKLEGTLDLRQVARLDELLEDRSLRFGALEHPARHRDVAVRASDDDLAGLPLSGYAAAARDALQERAAGGDADAEVATDALGLLLRLAGDRHGS
jgi:DNA repair exonuclease SbcCD nuclease subunit